MDQAITACASKWEFFCRSIPFKEEVTLQQRVMLFCNPAFEGMRKNFPELRKSPDAALFLFVLKGIQKSGTHSKAQIEKEFGLELPE